MPVVRKSKPYKTYVAQVDEIKRKWYLVDASKQTLGRLAVPIAVRLMGKDKPTYTPHLDTGDFVVVINADKVAVTGKKAEQKEYRRWSGYLGGLRRRTFDEQIDKDSREVIRNAVRRMLPKNLLAKRLITKLKVYKGTDHPHKAQKPENWAPLS